MFLLDTDTCIGHLTGRRRRITERLQALSPAQVALCSVVKGELLAGALKSQRPEENLQRLVAFFAPFESFSFDDRAADAYGRVRSSLELRGQPIGPNDLLIASIALAHGLVLVTSNLAEFSRVGDLAVESWA